MLEPSTTGVATRTLTEDTPPVTVGIRFPIAHAPIPVGLTAVPAPLSALAVAAAPVLLVAPDTADVAAEPQTQERPQLPSQNVRFANDDIVRKEKLPNTNPSTSTSDSSKIAPS